MLLLSFMKFVDWNENKIDINLFIKQFALAKECAQYW